MAYSSWSVVFGETPSAAKWNILGTNDASFNDGTGIANGAITPAKRAGGFKTGTIAPASTGSLATTGVGFTPKLLEFTLFSASSSTINYSGWGVADGTTQFATAMYNEQGVDNSGISATDRCFTSVTTNGAVIVDAAFTSFDADGFTVNVITRGGARSFNYRAYA